MKPGRIEELARLVNRRPWDDLADVERGKALRIARTLYAAAMRDAAGVARSVVGPSTAALKNHRTLIGARAHHHSTASAGEEIAATLETIAKEVTDDNG